MTAEGVVIFWLAVWVAYLLGRVVMLRFALAAWKTRHMRAVKAIVRAYSAVPQVEPEDGILDSEVIE